MYLLEDNVDVFSLLVDFLYRGIVPKVVSSTTPPRLDTLRLTCFYFLAEKLCMSDPMDRIIDEILSQCARECLMMGGQAIKWIYANKHENSKLRAYCVAILACCIYKKDHSEA
jgi:hypothetical protein